MQVLKKLKKINKKINVTYFAIQCLLIQARDKASKNCEVREMLVLNRNKGTFGLEAHISSDKEISDVSDQGQA